ncbi:MAG: hypothetical protein V4490_02975 [Pseudomonadota bacterium]
MAEDAVNASMKVYRIYEQHASDVWLQSAQQYAGMLRDKVLKNYCNPLLEIERPFIGQKMIGKIVRMLKKNTPELEDLTDICEAFDYCRPDIKEGRARYPNGEIKRFCIDEYKPELLKQSNKLLAQLIALMGEYYSGKKFASSNSETDLDSIWKGMNAIFLRISSIHRDYQRVFSVAYDSELGSIESRALKLVEQFETGYIDPLSKIPEPVVGAAHVEQIVKAARKRDKTNAFHTDLTAQCDAYIKLRAKKLTEDIRAVGFQLKAFVAGYFKGEMVPPSNSEKDLKDVQDCLFNIDRTMAILLGRVKPGAPEFEEMQKERMEFESLKLKMMFGYTSVLSTIGVKLSESQIRWILLHNLKNNRSYDLRASCAAFLQACSMQQNSEISDGASSESVSPAYDSSVGSMQSPAPVILSSSPVQEADAVQSVTSALSKVQPFKTV